MVPPEAVIIRSAVPPWLVAFIVSDVENLRKDSALSGPTPLSEQEQRTIGNSMATTWNTLFQVEFFISIVFDLLG
jgi:hypothetical protein